MGYYLNLSPFLLIATKNDAPNLFRVSISTPWTLVEAATRRLLWKRLEEASGCRNSMLLLDDICKLDCSF
jgi:hypothetical protein